VVGCQVGAWHARAYHRLEDCFDLVAVCDTQQERTAALADELGDVEAVTDYAKLLRRGGIDLISICTPPELHLAQMLQAQAAGCHVVCEKPLVGSRHDLDLLRAAEAMSGRRVVPIFQLRFGAGLQKLLRLVELGVTGRRYLATVETAWRRGDDWE
jgi:predicted dehydrogenase